MIWIGEVRYMPTNTNEVVNRTPTAPCRCTNPELGTVLEDQSGEFVEYLCARCHGAICRALCISGSAQDLEEKRENASKLEKSITVTGRRANGIIISETLMVPEGAWEQYTGIFPLTSWGIP
jgi:hypothetical protein